MKKILLLFFLAALTSCDIGEDDGINFSSEFMTIETVDIPAEFTFGQSHEITVNYTRPSNCYEFQRFVFDTNSQNTRTVGVVDTRYYNDSCQEISSDASASFNFSVTSLETYTFQFYQGKDENDQDQYLVIEVPVVE